MSDLETLEILQSAKNIAVLGISADTSKASNEVARYLISQGYNILPIHPKHSEILGKKAHKNLQEAFDENGAIDILNIFRKSEALEGIAKEIVALKNKPKYVWIQLGLRSPRAREIIQSAGIAYIEDSCIELEHKRLIAESSPKFCEKNI